MPNNLKQAGMDTHFTVSKILANEDASLKFRHRQVMVVVIQLLMRAEFWLLIRELGL